ncbi:MAG: hypothetical protein ACR2OZ_07310 [Verrucomicrobiales bacterium]
MADAGSISMAGPRGAQIDQGWGVPQISKEFNILPSTLHKAIDDGRLKRVKKKM